MITFFCWFCQRSFTTSVIKNKQLVTRIINGVTFIFSNCPDCRKPLYCWKTSTTVWTGPKLHIVLYKPEIVGNVGTIIRLAANFDFVLHLIEPFGFIYSDAWLKRSSANHLNRVKPLLYANWTTFLNQVAPSVLIMTSAKAKLQLSDLNLTNIVEPLYFVFGCESTGLPDQLLQTAKYCVKIPTTVVSSINLANSVSVVTYFALSQFKMLNLV